MKGRPLLTLSLTSTFLLSAASGLVLYVMPHGRVAHWAGWSLLGLDKDGWDALHVLSSTVFLLLAPLHLWLNWKPFKSFLRRKVAGAWRLRAELGLALLLAAWIAASSIWRLPPLYWLVDASEALKDAWPEARWRAPFGHAEQLPLGELLDKLGAEPTPELLDALREAGVPEPDPDRPFGELAREAGLSPAELWERVAPLLGLDAGSGRGRGAGRGQGGADEGRGRRGEAEGASEGRGAGRGWRGGREGRQ